jgi:hypothetical protein
LVGHCTIANDSAVSLSTSYSEDIRITVPKLLTVPHLCHIVPHCATLATTLISFNSTYCTQFRVPTNNRTIIQPDSHLITSDLLITTRLLRAVSAGSQSGLLLTKLAFVLSLESYEPFFDVCYVMPLYGLLNIATQQMEMLKL